MKSVVLRHCCLLLLGTVLGIALLVLAQYLPYEPIQQHVLDSAWPFLREGTYPRLVDRLDGSWMDNYTDALMLSTALTPPQENKLEQTLMAYQLRFPGKQPVESLIALSQSPESGTLISYNRYWHGYLLPLRLLLTRYSLEEIRLILFAGQFLLITVLLTVAGAEKRFGLCACLFLAYLSLYPPTLALSLQFSPCCILAFGGALILLLMYARLQSIPGGFSSLFFVLGMLTSYFDLLTYPVASLGIPLCTLLFLDTPSCPHIKKRSSPLQRLFAPLSCCVHWALGYGGFWAMKWVAGSLLTDESFFKSALSQFALRSSRSADDLSLHYVDIVQRNLNQLTLNTGFKLLFFAWCAICLIFTLRQLFCHKGCLASAFHIRLVVALPFILVAMIPFAWYFVAGNHSYIHYWFTYRTLSVSIMALSCTMAIFAGFHTSSLRDKLTEEA